MAQFYEFFAGGGMARAGLGRGWTCRFANDIDPRKARAYRANFGDQPFFLGDVRAVASADLPGVADLIWGSFPCQDLSLAGQGAGLDGERSGAFFAFEAIVRDLLADGRAPRLIAVENVCGALTSREGRDFQAICATFAALGYRHGAVVIDAALFRPQSRPRLFFIGVRADLEIDAALSTTAAVAPFHTTALRRAVDALPDGARAAWIWWNLPLPRPRATTIADVLEASPPGDAWDSQAHTAALLAMMSAKHRAQINHARSAGCRIVGALYRRTRRDAQGRRVQRAEVRFDDLAGCLRTPVGGSSRQTIIVVEGDRVRSRLISARETARLMGLSDDYVLPTNYNEAYHLTGDGVVVDVVRHLAQYVLEPLLSGEALGRHAA